MDEMTAVGAGQGGVEPPNRLKSFQQIQNCKRVLDTVLTWTGYLSGGLFAFTAFFITYDVLARKWGLALGIPTTRVTDEISGYALALAATWGLAYTLRTNSHVRIDVLLPYMPRRLRACMDFLAMCLMGFFACVISWKTWFLVLDSLQSDIRSSTYLLTPLYIPQAVLGVGFSLLAVTAIALAVFDFLEWVLSWGQPAELARAASTPVQEGMADPPRHGQGEDASQHDA